MVPRDADSPSNPVVFPAAGYFQSMTNTLEFKPTVSLAIIILVYLKTEQYQFPLPAGHFQPVLDWWGRL